eukprot:145219-Pelagomonas_calceolata.AAC.14
MSTLSPSKASKSPSKGSAHETCAHAGAACPLPVFFVRGPLLTFNCMLDASSTAHAAMAEDHPGRCRCPGNDELYLFLMWVECYLKREVILQEEREPSRHMHLMLWGLLFRCSSV